MEILTFTLPAERSVAIPPASAVFVRSGTVAWQTRNSDVLMDVNHALLFPPSASPAVLTANDGQACLTFICDSQLDYGSAPSLRLLDSALFLEHYRLVIGAHDADAAQRAARIVAILRTCAPKKPDSDSARSPSYGRTMQQYVNAMPAQPVSLRSIARLCAVSPFTASRVFHREAGLSLRIYVRRLRLRTALARIAAHHDLSEVALELGFFDHSHFTRAFRAEFGIAPSQWRDVVATAPRVAA